MGYDNKITVGEFDVHFDYGYNGRGQFLECEGWTAYLDGKECQIQDVSISEKIEAEIDTWLDDEFSNNSSDYEADYLDYLGDMAYESYRESMWEE